FVHQVMSSQTRKPHVIPSVMVPTSRDHAVGTHDVHFVLEKLQGVLVYLFVIDETDGVADLPMFHTGGNLFDKALAQVVVNIQLGIAGYFDHVGRYGFKLEHGEDIVQAKPDKVIQHDDVIFLPLFGKDHKTVYALWDFN